MYQRIPAELDYEITESLIKKRGNWAKYTSLIVFFSSSLYFVLTIIFPNGKEDYLKVRSNHTNFNESLGMCYFTPSVIHVLTRLFLCTEELRHIGSRYDDCKAVFKVALFNDIWDVFHFTLASFIVVWYYLLPEYISTHLFCSVTLATFQVFLGWGPVEVRRSLMHTPAIGTAMAWSAYLTYYSRIIPCLKSGILELEKQGISFPLKKLIFVFPTSCDVDGAFKCDSISCFHFLKHSPIDQVGNVNRALTSCIYKIEQENEEPLYCAMEKPAPLRVFREMRKSGKMSSDQLSQQIALFYQQLDDLLMEDKNCQDSYLFVKYTDDKDSKPWNLQDLIQQKVREELNREKQQEAINIDT